MQVRAVKVKHGHHARRTHVRGTHDQFRKGWGGGKSNPLSANLLCVCGMVEKIYPVNSFVVKKQNLLNTNNNTISCNNNNNK
jgi:hypothetical protein